MESTSSTERILRSLSGRVYHERKSADEPVTAILTYPLRDYAGDYVKPDGGDWTPFTKYPIINWAHRAPIGRGTVCHKALTFNGQTTPVAVGETEFFTKASDFDGVDLTKFDDPNIRNPVGEYSVQECLDIAHQAARLVADDIATGVSIEFTPNGKKGDAYWDLDGTSALENRPPRHFEKWIGYTYAHARTPVNPGCRTLLQDQAEAIAKAFEIAKTGKIGGDKAHPLIIKAFIEDEDLLRSNGKLIKSWPTSTAYPNSSAKDNTDATINRTSGKTPIGIDLAAGGNDLLRQIAAGWFDPTAKSFPMNITPIIKGIMTEQKLPFRQAAKAFESSMRLKGVKIRGGTDRYWDAIDRLGEVK